MRASDTIRDSLEATDATAVVAKARQELAAGDDKSAARLLMDAAYQTRDPEIERQVRELATQGLEQAGRFGKGRWKEILRVVDSLRAYRQESPPPVSTA